MKKLLLGSAAVALGLTLAVPAHAQVDLDLGGHFKGYVGWTDQDTTAANDERSIDWFQETEVHFSGETTLDNGLTVGAHVEAEADESDNFAIDESYAYFSGAWGRVNAGNEDGAAYLLQVAAPSADSNIDGIRQFVNPFNYGLTSSTGTYFSNAAVGLNNDGLDYDNDLTTETNKLTYLSPVFNGFQLGASYTPDVNNFTSFTNSLGGTSQDDQGAGNYGEAYEGALRYEGQFEEVGFSFGAGYTHVEEEGSSTTTDDFQEWNVGLDMDWGAFGLGVVYTENNNGSDANDENDTWVVGADYTTGPYKIGASYLNNDSDIEGSANEMDTDRFTGGVTYTYGPGMTFRGSVSYVDLDDDGTTSDPDATSILLGTQINF